MKTSTRLIKEMAKLGVIEVENIKHKRENDITIITEMGVEKRVILDDVTDEELPLMIMTTQLKTVKNIERMVKFFYYAAIIGIVLAIILFMMQIW